MDLQKAELISDKMKQIKQLEELKQRLENADYEDLDPFFTARVDYYQVKVGYNDLNEPGLANKIFEIASKKVDECILKAQEALEEINFS